MIMTKENDFSCAKNNWLELAVMSVVGDRKRQEDCFGYQADDDYLLMCVCDGMGGYDGGGIASRTAVNAIVRAFDYGRFAAHPTAQLNELTAKANDEVVALHRGVENASLSLKIKEMFVPHSIGCIRLFSMKEFICRCHPLHAVGILPILLYAIFRKSQRVIQ